MPGRTLGLCGAERPKATVSRTPDHASGARGARKRRSPSGGAANGMPRKRSWLGRRSPDTFPWRVSTRTFMSRVLQVSARIAQLGSVHARPAVAELGVALAERRLQPLLGGGLHEAAR